LIDQTINILLSVVSVVAALAVTLHLLLRKRYMPSAIGWIGLAWLVPLIGSLLYVAFGINRVERRARRLRRRRMRGSRRQTGPGAKAVEKNDALAAFRRAVGRITQRGAEPGNAVDMLTDGDEAYPAMLEAISTARSTVFLSSYIFRVDDAGQPLIDALAAAQLRGVAIRVLIDGIGGGYFASPAYRALRRAGIPAARFLWSVIPWRMPLLNMRTHKKILVVDGKVAFTGGMNIGAENFRKTPAGKAVRDTHFRITGPVVAQLAETFADDWLFAAGENIDHLLAPPPEPTGNVLARMVTSGPDQEIARLELVLLSAIGTPYFLPGPSLMMALELAALRGVAVEIVIPKECDHRYFDWATSAHIPSLLDAGCRIWYGKPPFNHAKLMTMDGTWSLIGSGNWDTRSLRLNFELNVEVHDADLAERLNAAMLAMRNREIDMAESVKRPFPVVLRDAAIRLLLPYL
jgi:cardiolipin synthase